MWHFGQGGHGGTPPTEIFWEYLSQNNNGCFSSCPGVAGLLMSLRTGSQKIAIIQPSLIKVGQSGYTGYLINGDEIKGKFL